MASITTRLTTATKSRGTALPTALLVLIVLTLLGTAAVLTSSTELDIAGNGRRELQALSVAEAGVHEALARLNMRDPSAPIDFRIVPGEVAGAPNPAWSRTIVNAAALGANQVQTATGAFGAAGTLPISTRIAYKLEDAAEAPVTHCNGAPPGTACDPPGTPQVVLFHTSFNYGGPSVPNGPIANAPPVLSIVSTYTDPVSGGQKTLTIEAVRRLTQFNTPATVRACGPVTVTGATNIDGTGAPGNTAIMPGQAPAPVPGGGTSVTGVIAPPQPCPAPPLPPLFDATFGMTSDELQALADIKANAGTQPASVNGKIIWIKNDPPATLTSWSGNYTYGTATAPVIIVVEGDFRIQGNVTLFGVLYVKGNFTIGAGTPNINGAVITEGTATLNLTGASTFAFNPASISNLNRLSPFTTLLWQVN